MHPECKLVLEDGSVVAAEMVRPGDTLKNGVVVHESVHFDAQLICINYKLHFEPFQKLLVRFPDLPRIAYDASRQHYYVQFVDEYGNCQIKRNIPLKRATLLQAFKHKTSTVTIPAHRLVSLLEDDEYIELVRADGTFEHVRFAFSEPTSPAVRFVVSKDSSNPEEPLYETEDGYILSSPLPWASAFSLGLSRHDSLLV